MKNKLASIKIFSWEFIWLLFCGFMTIVWISEVWDVKTAPEKYACLWGGEGPVAQLWYYASESLYLLHLACLIVWFLSGIWLCVCRWTFKRALLLAHVCLSMLWLTAALITNCWRCRPGLPKECCSWPCSPLFYPAPYCQDIWGYPYWCHANGLSDGPVIPFSGTSRRETKTSM